MESFISRIRDAFDPKITDEVKNELDRSNIRMMHMFSIIIVVLICFGIVMYAVSSGGFEFLDPATTISDIACAAVCTAYIIAAGLLRKEKKVKHAPTVIA